MNNIATFCGYTYPFLTAIFSPVWLTVYTYPVKKVTENASFQNRYPEWRFLKTLAFRLRVDGRKQGFSNTIMPSLRMVCEGIYRISLNHFSVFVRTGEKD